MELIIKAKTDLKQKNETGSYTEKNVQYARKLLKFPREQWLKLNLRRARYQ